METQMKVAPFEAEVSLLLQFARERGLEHVEVYARRDEALTLRANQGSLESFQRSHSMGIGIRVVDGESVGYAYSENLSAEALRRALGEAAGNAELVEGEPGAGLPLDVPDATAMDGLYNTQLDAVKLEDKIRHVLKSEETARTCDARVKAVPGCVYSDATSLVRVANSQGLDRYYQTNQSYSVVFPLVSFEGENRTGIDLRISRDFFQLDPEAIARAAVGHAVKRLGARPVKSGTYPVVFTHRAMGDLLSAFSDVFSAKAALEHKSLLAGKLGAQVASPLVSFIDDALMLDGFASRPFDDEGVPSRRVAMVEAGVFKTFLHNTQTARRMQAVSTGHAARGSYKGTVGVSPSNFYLQPGTATHQALVAGDGPVVMIDDLQGLHAGTNTISGDFSIQAQGWLYEKGEEVHAVSNITVAGNFLAMLAGVEAVGADLHFYPHGAYIGAPSVRIAALAIAGD